MMAAEQFAGDDNVTIILMMGIGFFQHGHFLNVFAHLRVKGVDKTPRG